MFLHSAHLDLTDTLLFEEGVRLRCATVAVSPPHGCPGLPPLMPTSQVVVEVPLTSWLQLDSLGPPQAKILKHPVRTLHCALAFTNGAAPRAGAAPLSGWVVAQVAKVGGVTSGAPWNARSSVTVSLSEAAAFAGSISNGSWEDDGGKAVARQGGGQHAAKAQVALVLRDDQTALGQLLCEGETVALLGAALLSPEPLADPGAHGMQPLAAAAERDGAGGGCSGSEGRVLLLGQRYLVVAPSVPGSEGTGEPGAMEVDGLPCQQQQQQHQQQQQQQQQHQQQQQQHQQAAATTAGTHVLPPLGTLQAGAKGLVLWGRVYGLRRQGGGQLVCTLASMAAGGSSIKLRMRLADGPYSKVGPTCVSCDWRAGMPQRADFTNVCPCHASSAWQSPVTTSLPEHGVPLPHDNYLLGCTVG
jgi:hypothetical protein